MNFKSAVTASRIVNILTFIYYKTDDAINRLEKTFNFYWNECYGMTVDYCIDMFRYVRTELATYGYVVEFHREVRNGKLFGWEVRVSFEEEDVEAGHLTSFVFPDWCWSTKRRRFVKYETSDWDFYSYSFDKMFTMIYDD